MAKLTHKKLKALVLEANEGVLKSKPFGFILDEDTLYLVQRKGGDRLRLVRGTTRDIHLVFTIFLTLDAERFYAIARPNTS